MWCKFGHATPQMSAPTKPSCSTKRVLHTPESMEATRNDWSGIHNCGQSAQLHKITHQPGTFGETSICFSGTLTFAEAQNIAPIRFRLPPSNFAKGVSCRETLSHRMSLLISFMKSTPPQNYQLDILIRSIKQCVDDFVGELAFQNHSIDTLCQMRAGGFRGKRGEGNRHDSTALERTWHI